ncbi:MAG TPA: molybdopterin cofactor-binding domain-containing protein [Terriglobales bacterium]|jgi:isoquinoline 1-oxidoreductase|nr:molybdopterin cofactor-binding domain-containing protein [Terriglobales bacterium]
MRDLAERSEVVADEIHDHEIHDPELRQHNSISRLPHTFNFDRRGFFKVLGGGLLVCIAARHSIAQESGATVHHDHELPKTLDSWLHISENGQVTAFTGKVEVGQNVRTSLAQQVAEELRVPLSSVRLIMGDTELTPYDMGTFGSRTTPQMGMQLRKVSASARTVLIGMAAEHWASDATGLTAEEGKVRDSKTNRSISYAELVHGQKLSKIIADDPELTPAKDWKIAGTPAPKTNGHAFVTGAHQYTSDMKRPGMLHGKVVRPTAFHAKLISCDTSQAEKIPGVSVVRDGDFIGVSAADVMTADRAAQAIRAQWEAPSQISDRELFDQLRKPASDKDDDTEQYLLGSVEQSRGQAVKTLRQTYTVAYIAHTPLEPRAAVAEWKDGKLTVWTGTQRPFAVGEELAEALRVPTENVRVIVPDTGSAYGGKHTGEAAVEAARLAKSAGQPVKLIWSREEEFTWAYFRPAGVIDVSSGAKADGTLVFWEFDNYNSGPAAMRTPYEVANQRITFHPSDAPLRQGSYRSLAAAANHFARESHMDEVAHELRIDPLEFRLKNLRNDRLRAVFEAAAEKFGWGKQKNSSGSGFGIAGGFEKGGYIATCAEVSVKSGAVKVVRVVQAFDCGAVVNPQGLKNQNAGAIMQGLGGALFEAIRFENGRIVNPHLAEYRVPRFSDLPHIDVVLVDRKDQRSMGAGETPLTGIAPAVANAIFGAAGVRLRSMPLAPSGLPAQST